MWVYQEPEIQPIEKGPITPPPSLPPVPEQEPLPAIVQSTPETTVPHIPETEVLSRTAPASHRERSAPHQGCVLLAVSYLSGAFTAGILQALLDTAEMDMLSYYLRCWRGLFAVQSASQIAQLFGAELLTILGVLCVLLLLGLSAIGPVPIYLFTMLYGAGAGLLTFQLFPAYHFRRRCSFFLFPASRRHWLQVHFAGLAPARWKSAEDSMLFLLGGGGAPLPMPSCYWDNLH